MVNTTTTTFSHKKRVFLLTKLDEVIKLWASGEGQGSFNFSVQNGTPSLQCGLQLDMADVIGIAPVPHQHHANHDGVRPRRRRGPARQARDRQRAAQHQADLAAAVSAASTSVTTNNTVVTTSVSSSLTTSSAHLSPAVSLATNLLSPAVGHAVRDEVLAESESEEEEESQYLTRIPQLDGSSTLPADQWSCKCCRYESFYPTEDLLQQHHETHMLGYEDCNICFTCHVWTSR